jgi:hypothetical protein
MYLGIDGLKIESLKLYKMFKSPWNKNKVESRHKADVRDPWDT